MNSQMKEPWKIDTNDKYTEVVKTIMGLASAALLLPVFLAREFLGVDSKQPLSSVLGCSIYWAWFMLGCSVLAGVFFQYLSAKWVRIAWGKEAGIFFSKKTKESTVELWMEISFWFCVLLFVLGVVLTLSFFLVFNNGS